ncbi:MAG: penicillin-binding protein 2, partial [Chlorobi bacterium]|nr:penicillin-binding protein 2 [Chlorobiota bacterium]
MNNSRVLIVIAVVFLVLMILVGRLFNIQVADHERYARIAEKQQNKTVKIKAERGLITDRNNDILAYTKDDVSLFVDTRMTNKKAKERIAAKFAKVFGKKKKHYLRLLNSANKNICLEKKAVKEDVMQLSEFVVEGYFQIEDYSRVYPYGSLASHVLGYVDRKLTGVSGIEKYFDDKLTGTDGYKLMENDVLGRVVTVNQEFSRKPVPGNTVKLTINKTYQKILETEVQKGLNKFKGKSAVGIILNPNTGEILALTNQPDYDPKHYNIFPSYKRRNRSITDTYEPGSTIKPLTMSILLNEDLTYENEKINTENGVYRVRGATIRDTHEYDYLTSTGIIQHSSNVGIAKLSDRIDEDTFYRYLRNYGFGSLTCVDLPGETPGLLKKPKYYSKISKKFISFGYEISVTPLQLALAYSALVNGGELMQPYVVQQVTDSRGNVVEEFIPKKIRRVVTEKTSDRVKKMMKEVVEDGTGTEAYIPGVSIGGKTGTSQKLINKRYSNKEYNSSFVGFFPVENPQILILIVVSSPKIGRYGGKVAAPIFHEVAKRILDNDGTEIKKEVPNNKHEIAPKLKLQQNKDIFVTSNLPEQRVLFPNSGKKKKYSVDSTVMPNLNNFTKRE